MFRVLVVLTTALFVTEGVFEIALLDERFGWVMISIAALIAGAGSLASPYATELERRRRGGGN
jgi:hypothetical protein